MYNHGYNDNLVARFDEEIRENTIFNKWIGEFTNWRKDFISSDREAAAAILTYEAVYNPADH